MVAGTARRAAVAARELVTWVGERRRDLLHGCAEALGARSNHIVAVASEESGLTEARLRGELDRTTGQLRPRPLRRLRCARR